MPRANRLTQTGLLHHVIAKGNAKQSLFHDVQDHMRYLELLREAVTKHPLAVYNYCLCGPVVHLLVEAREEGALSKAMEKVTREYARYFNQKYNSEGHVFQGRFKSFALQDDLYYFPSSRYIDLIPVRQGKVPRPEEYQWSGFSSLAYGRQDAFGIDQHELYQELGAADAERRLVYRNLINQNLGPEVDFEQRKAGILGSREFKNLLKSGSADISEAKKVLRKIAF